MGPSVQTSRSRQSQVSRINGRLAALALAVGVAPGETMLKIELFGRLRTSPRDRHRGLALFRGVAPRALT